MLWTYDPTRSASVVGMNYDYVSWVFITTTPLSEHTTNASPKTVSPGVTTTSWCSVYCAHLHHGPSAPPIVVIWSEYTTNAGYEMHHHHQLTLIRRHPHQFTSVGRYPHQSMLVGCHTHHPTLVIHHLHRLTLCSQQVPWAHCMDLHQHLRTFCGLCIPQIAGVHSQITPHDLLKWTNNTTDQPFVALLDNRPSLHETRLPQHCVFTVDAPLIYIWWVVWPTSSLSMAWHHPRTL